MPYVDLHVRFRPEQARLASLGYAKALAAGEQVEEHVARDGGGLNRQAAPGRISILAGENAELLRKGVKRFDLIYVSSFYPDTALMREVADEKKAFEIPISGLLRSYGFSRAALLGRMRFFLSLCIKHDADYVLTSRAENAYELKSVDEMVAIGYALGLTPPQTKRALGAVAERVMAKQE